LFEYLLGTEELSLSEVLTKEPGMMEIFAAKNQDAEQAKEPPAKKTTAHLTGLI
jgi:hypothetical protein